MVAGAAAATRTEASPVDARPIRVTSTETLWDSALSVRDRCASQMRNVLAQEGISPLVLVSQHGNYPPWARLEAWVPSGAPGAPEKERVELDIIVDIKPCHRTEIVHTARLKKGKTNISVTERPSFTPEDVAEWTRYAIDRGPRPSNYRPGLDLVLRSAGRLIPPLALHRNPVAKPYRSSGLTLARFLKGGAVVIWLLSATVGPVAPAIVGLAVIPWLGALIAAPFIIRRRRHIVAVTSQPLVSPRNLGLVDSWQAVVTGLGGNHQAMREQLDQQITASERLGIQSQWETYGYRTSNGYEERERLVIVKGQSVVQAHVYPFGPDLFVGWHAYLNWAKWDESKIGSSRIENGREVEFYGLRPGVYIPSLFDLVDLNGLSDLVHRNFERELKTLLKERAIDQEIDFEIIRGDRDLALDKSRHVAEGATSRWSRIMSAASSWQPASVTELRQSTAATGGTSTAAARKVRPLELISFLLVLAILFAIAWPAFLHWFERAAP